MIEGRQNITRWFESTGYPYWLMFHQGKTDSGNWIAKSSEQESATASTALDELQKQISLQSTGRFTLVATEKVGYISKGTYRTDFAISFSDNQPQAAAMPTIGGIPENYISKDDVGAQIKAALSSYKAEVELEALKLRVKELEQENKEFQANDPFTKIAGIAAEYLPALMPQILGAAPAMAGTGTFTPPQTKIYSHPIESEMDATATEQERDLSPDEAERLSRVITVFADKAGDEWLAILEAMAKKIEANPSLLQTLKMFLS